MVNIKSCLHVWGFPDLSKTGALWGSQNVTKHKSIGPCITELGPKIRVNLGFLLRQRIWTSAYYLHDLTKERDYVSILSTICVMALRIRISQLKIQVTLTFSPTPIIWYLMSKHPARIYSMLQPWVKVTENLFFDEYLRSDCPVSVQVSCCTLWSKRSQ